MNPQILSVIRTNVYVDENKEFTYWVLLSDGYWYPITPEDHEFIYEWEPKQVYILDTELWYFLVPRRSSTYITPDNIIDYPLEEWEVDE